MTTETIKTVGCDACGREYRGDASSLNRHLVEEYIDFVGFSVAICRGGDDDGWIAGGCRLADVNIDDIPDRDIGFRPIGD